MIAVEPCLRPIWIRSADHGESAAGAAALCFTALHASERVTPGLSDRLRATGLERHRHHRPLRQAVRLAHFADQHARARCKRLVNSRPFVRWMAMT